MLGISSFFFVNLLATFSEVQSSPGPTAGTALPRRVRGVQEPHRRGGGAALGRHRGGDASSSPRSSPCASSPRRSATAPSSCSMTAPVRPWEIVLGKYLGGVGVVWGHPRADHRLPSPLSISEPASRATALEWSTVALGFGGVLLWGATCLAVGMFVSALTESQMLAAFLTFAILLSLDAAPRAGPERRGALAQRGQLPLVQLAALQRSPAASSTSRRWSSSPR